MTMTLIDSAGMPAHSPNTGTLELKSEAYNPTDGPSFGQHLSDMFQLQTDKLPPQAPELEGTMPAPIGQEIADPFALGPQAAQGAPTWALQAVTLGPHLNVITPTTAAPDEQSLEAFARAQGLDEKAVHWLFGGVANRSTPTTQASTETPSTAPPNTAHASVLTWTAATSLTPPASSQGVIGTPSAGAPAGPPAASAAPPGPAPMASLHASALPATASNDTATSLLGGAMAGAQALWAMAESHSDAKKPVTSHATSTEEALPLQMLRMPPPAAVWMQRTAMNPAGPDPMTTAKGVAISLSNLDLGADWGGDVLQQLLANEGSAGNGANATGTHSTAYANFAARWDAQAANRADLSPANTPPADLPDAAARSENIQSLADKMGQAVGQRILSEMERGQWHLKLSLRPATLGHIEVEMRLRSGEFDAVFTAPNAVTRDLLQDGLAKLRETLSQMGMDVANIHVGDGQTGQSGGDSTPGGLRGQPASQEAGAAETAPETTRAPSVKDPADGLDVLV